MPYASMLDTHRRNTLRSSDRSTADFGYSCALTSARAARVMATASRAALIPPPPSSYCRHPKVRSTSIVLSIGWRLLALAVGFTGARNFSSELRPRDDQASAAQSLKVRSERTTSNGCIACRLLPNTTFDGPFTLDEKLRQQRGRPCTAKTLALKYNGTVNLAIARTGSATVQAFARDAGWANQHAHECNLEHFYRRGARRALVSLRHPVARVISGFQRRATGADPSKAANRLFGKSFGSLDAYIDALRDERSAFHRVALEVSVGANEQSYLLPVAEFYLAGFERVARDARGAVIDVGFACTTRLDDDLVALLHAWGTRKETMKVRAVAPGVGATAADAAATAPKERHASAVKSETGRDSMISEANAAWLERLYARDVALDAAHCAGRVSGTAEVVRYRRILGEPRLTANGRPWSVSGPWRAPLGGDVD